MSSFTLLRKRLTTSIESQGLSRDERKPVIDIPTSCEDHYGQRLLRKAEFKPVSMTYIPHW